MADFNEVKKDDWYTSRKYDRVTTFKCLFIGRHMIREQNQSKVGFDEEHQRTQDVFKINASWQHIRDVFRAMEKKYAADQDQHAAFEKMLMESRDLYRTLIAFNPYLQLYQLQAQRRTPRKTDAYASNSSFILFDKTQAKNTMQWSHVKTFEFVCYCFNCLTSFLFVFARQILMILPFSLSFLN